MTTPVQPPAPTPAESRADLPPPAPGDQRPRLDRPPSDRYAARPTIAASRLDEALWPVAVVIGGVLAFTVVGGWLAVTAGLLVVAIFLGWLIGRLVEPPWRAAIVALVAVALGFLGIWLFGRIEGGVLDPIEYLIEVEGPILVVLCLAGGAGIAAAASR